LGNVEAWHPQPGAPLRFRLRFVATLQIRLGTGSGLSSAVLFGLVFFDADQIAIRYAEVENPVLDRPYTEEVAARTQIRKAISIQSPIIVTRRSRDLGIVFDQSRHAEFLQQLPLGVERNSEVVLCWADSCLPRAHPHEVFSIVGKVDFVGIPPLHLPKLFERSIRLGLIKNTIGLLKHLVIRLAESRRNHEEEVTSVRCCGDSWDSRSLDVSGASACDNPEDK